MKVLFIDKVHPSLKNNLIENNFICYESYNLSKKDDFIGSNSVKEKLKNGVAIKIVHLEIDADSSDAIGNEPIYHNGKIVGVVTSGGFGHRINKSLAFGYVDSDKSEKNIELEVEILGKRRKAS